MPSRRFASAEVGACHILGMEWLQDGACAKCYETVSRWVLANIPCCARATEHYSSSPFNGISRPVFARRRVVLIAVRE